jgi:hypothetical protein
MEDNYATHRNRRNEICEQRGYKIENAHPKHPVIDGLGGLLERTANAHQKSAQQQQRRLPDGTDPSSFTRDVDQFNRTLKDGSSPPPADDK